MSNDTRDMLISGAVLLACVGGLIALDSWVNRNHDERLHAKAMADLEAIIERTKYRATDLSVKFNEEATLVDRCRFNAMMIRMNTSLRFHKAAARENFHEAWAARFALLEAEEYYV